jgi:hypothetical protein
LPAVGSVARFEEDADIPGIPPHCWGMVHLFLTSNLSLPRGGERFEGTAFSHPLVVQQKVSDHLPHCL